jgi:N-acetylmuramoyl-L-alanine amidase
MRTSRPNDRPEFAAHLSIAADVDKKPRHGGGRFSLSRAMGSMTKVRARRRTARTVLALALLSAVVSVGTVEPGSAVTRIREKDVNLDIARRVQARLAAARVPVVMTRTTDRTVTLAQRTTLANAKRVDVFVSIHNNASRNRSAGGTEIYRQIRGGDSARLASNLRSTLSRSPGLPTSIHARRGDHGDYYYQLRNTKMPAVIVECAYISNPREARLLASSSFRQRLADSIAAGILAYQRSLVARPLPDTVTPTRVAVPALAAPEGATGRAVNSRTVSLAWQVGVAAAYNVYRNGVLIGSVKTPVLGALDAPGSVSFTDVWAAPGQRYTYEIASAVQTGDVSLESQPARVVVRTPPIVVALDPGHGGADPGAGGTY